jgi:hypothetical protein
MTADLPVSAGKHEGRERISMVVVDRSMSRNHVIRVLEFVYGYTETVTGGIDRPYMMR